MFSFWKGNPAEKIVFLAQNSENCILSISRFSHLKPSE
jgi:hypothetical protein